MPGYLANRAFSNVTEMKNFLVDDTDEDMLGPFILPVDANDYRIVVWRKYSNKVVDNKNVYQANGPGRWIVLPTITNITNNYYNNNSGGSGNTGGGGNQNNNLTTGNEYWNRASEFAELSEWLTNSKDYSNQNWLTEYPGYFIEGGDLGDAVSSLSTGLKYWNRASEFAELSEWLTNSNNYDLQDWLSVYPGNFTEEV